MAKLSPADREQIERFQEYLKAVGPRSGDDQADAVRVRTWIDEDPEERQAYLGLEREALLKRLCARRDAIMEAIKALGADPLYSG